MHNNSIILNTSTLIATSSRAGTPSTLKSTLVVIAAVSSSTKMCAIDYKDSISYAAGWGSCLAIQINNKVIWL